MIKSSGFSNCSLSMGTWAVESWKDMYFESRKKRPQDRGKKKRRKGKRIPTDLVWNKAQARNCSFRHLHSDRYSVHSFCD
jgi:hypothetical protein